VRSSRLQQALRLLFRLEPGEGVRAGLMLVYSIAVIGGVVITGQLVSRSLFLSSLPPTDIPYKYILPPVALMLATGLYARIASRFRRDRLIVGTCAAMLAIVVGFRLVLASPGGHSFAALCALFVAFDVIGDLAALQFWTFAGDIFNPREARRLFGLIGGGSTVANLIFGLALSSTANLVRPENLTFLMMGGLVVCAACAGSLGRRHRDELDELTCEAQSPAAEERGWRALTGLRDVFQSPLVLTMGGIVALVALVSNIADYQLDLALQSAFGGDGQGMVAFLGQFRFWAGLGAGALQFFLAGRLMERFGVAPVLLMLPLAMALGSGAILLTGGVLWAAAAPRACDVVLKYTVNDAALNLLYLPVGPRLRARAKAVLDGIVRPPLVTALGIAFLAVGPSYSVVHWAWPVLGLVAVWLVLVRRASRQYVTALSDSVQYRRLDLDRATVDLSDEGSHRVIAASLSAPDPMRVVHALSLLSRIPGDWLDAVVGLLGHADGRVRALALDYLAREGDERVAGRAVASLDDPVEEVRAAAAVCLCALQGQDSLARVQPLLDDPSTRVRGAAVVGLIRHAGLDGVLLAGERLKVMFTHPDAAARVEAARILEDLRAPTFYHPLVELLADDEMDVQLAALHAAAHLEAPPLLPALLPLLGPRATRSAAARAVGRTLARDPAPAAPHLADASLPPAVRVELVRTLGRVRSAAAAALVRPLVTAGDDDLRGASREALLSLRDRGVAPGLDRADLLAALRHEVTSAGQLVARQGRVAAWGDSLLLADALARRVRAARRRLVALLDLLHPEVAYRWVCEGLEATEARRRAAALELLDNVVERNLRAELLPLLSDEGRPADDDASPLPGDSEARQHLLAELAASGDHWVRACALYDVGAHRRRALDGAATAALTAPDPCVRQTAAWVLQRLLPPDQVIARLTDPARCCADLEDLLTRLRQGDARMPLSTLEKVFFLKSVPLFAHIPGEEVVELVPIIREVDIPAGETFIRRGEEGDCLYILVEGQVTVPLGPGRERTMNPGDVIGELAVLTEQPRTADCRACGDVVLLRIDKAEFWELMNRQPRITIEVMRVLVDRYVSERAET